MTASRSLPGAPRSLFVLKPSSFGDIVHTLPAVARLKQCWPDTRISWLVNPEWEPLLRDNPVVDEAVIFPRKDFGGWRGLERLGSWLRGAITHRRPDIAVDFQGLLRTALIGRCSRAQRFFGLADAREGARWLYDAVAAIPNGVPHAIDRYLALSDFVLREAVGIQPAQSEAGPLRYPLPDGQPLEGAELAGNDFVLLHPFARGREKSLNWLEVEAICARLAPKTVVVAGTWQGATPVLPVNSLNLLNRTTLPQLLWLIRGAAFVISVDSGPAHLAAALGKPMVAIHTWSDPRRVGPHRPEAWIMKNGAMMQVRSLRQLDESFFEPVSRRPLTTAQLDAICRLATSPSDFCA